MTHRLMARSMQGTICSSIALLPSMSIPAFEQGRMNMMILKFIFTVTIIVILNNYEFFPIYIVIVGFFIYNYRCIHIL